MSKDKMAYVRIDACPESVDDLKKHGFFIAWQAGGECLVHGKAERIKAWLILNDYEDVNEENYPTLFGLAYDEEDEDDLFDVTVRVGDQSITFYGVELLEGHEGGGPQYGTVSHITVLIFLGPDGLHHIYRHDLCTIVACR